MVPIDSGAAAVSFFLRSNEKGRRLEVRSFLSVCVCTVYSHSFIFIFLQSLLFLLRQCKEEGWRKKNGRTFILRYQRLPQHSALSGSSIVQDCVTGWWQVSLSLSFVDSVCLCVLAWVSIFLFSFLLVATFFPFANSSRSIQYSAFCSPLFALLLSFFHFQCATCLIWEGSKCALSFLCCCCLISFPFFLTIAQHSLAFRFWCRQQRYHSLCSLWMAQCHCH